MIVDPDGMFYLIIKILVSVVMVCLFPICGMIIRKRMVKENDDLDMTITGRIAGYQEDLNSRSLPGYGRPIIIYEDPYTGQMARFFSLKDVRKKKHPDGSRYQLMYSREKRIAYEKETNRVNHELMVAYFAIGILVVVAVIVQILHAVV